MGNDMAASCEQQLFKSISRPATKSHYSSCHFISQIRLAFHVFAETSKRLYKKLTGRDNN
jgi:hypothetical protein